MTHPQLPPVPHVTRNASAGGQPYRWAVMVNLEGEGRGEIFRDGILMGYQGWYSSDPGAFWRYWDGDLLGRRIAVWQSREPSGSYVWKAHWFEPDIDDPSLLINSELQGVDGLPWGTVIYSLPWIAFTPYGDPGWLPGYTNVQWYRTYQEAVAAWPDCLRQDDYLETWGVYLIAP